MLKIYHNPRCSKSRQTLQLIRDKGIEPEIILYLDERFNSAELVEIINKLGMDDPRQLMRRGEADYKDNDLKNETDPEELIAAMIRFPKLIERPIVVKGEKAVLGRPPENVNDLLD